jgi:hypothetical protein
MRPVFVAVEIIIKCSEAVGSNRQGCCFEGMAEF